MIYPRTFLKAYKALRAGRKIDKTMLYYIEMHARAYDLFVRAYEAKKKKELDFFIENVLESDCAQCLRTDASCMKFATGGKQNV